jgi:diguanylate cyclase (GGDEF)-like protein
MSSEWPHKLTRNAMLDVETKPDVAERLETLNSLNLLDTPIQERFERITRMVRRVLDVPISHFNLLDVDRQHLKSVQGQSVVDAPLDGAFCTHAVRERKMLLLPDASQDERFADNPFVTGKYLNIRFYVGCPVKAPNGVPIGTLCGIDTKPREMTPEQIAFMQDLVAMVETELRECSLSHAQTSLIARLNAAERLARIDCLTRLWNRAGILELLDREWAEAARHGKLVTLVMADLDRFKAINDTYGHDVGDAVIAGTAKRLLEATRCEDAVGRLGGEEFLVILTTCAMSSVRDAVERIKLSVMNTDYSAGDDRFVATISCGVAAAVPERGAKWETLLKEADKALYRAKQLGRNRIEFADDVDAPHALRA